MSVFIEAYGSLHKLLTQIGYELDQAETYLRRREAIIVLEVAPDILKQKGLASTKDLRDAVVVQDKQFQDLYQVKSILEATYAYVRGRLKNFEMSYQSVKKVYNEDEIDGNVHNLRDGPDMDKVERGLIGKTKYGTY